MVVTRAGALYSRGHFVTTNLFEHQTSLSRRFRLNISLKAKRIGKARARPLGSDQVQKSIKLLFPIAPIRAQSQRGASHFLQFQDSAQNHFRPSAACGRSPTGWCNGSTLAGRRPPTYRRASWFRMAEPVSRGRLRPSEMNFVLETKSSP